jgi:coenzyme F420-0:L-glutamate ligase/coenzyme F420-1:gamma-L-glutamate ligase
MPLVHPGDDIAALICTRAKILDKDIVVVSSTIVSKSEGRIIPLKEVEAGDEARRIAGLTNSDSRFIQVVLDESIEVLLEAPFMLVRSKCGHICVNAGVDRSNVEEEDNVLLLPEDPDASARRIKEGIFKRSNKRVSVVVTDTNGRAFRIGQTGAAIGIAGILPTKDWRGTLDLFGRTLEIKNEAIVDEIAGFGNILMGEGNGGTPVAVIRGLDLYSEAYGIRGILRPKEEDVIRRALLANNHI